MSSEDSTTQAQVMDLTSFRAEVVNHPDLFEQLRQAPDDDGFGALAVELGRTRGFSFSKEEVQVALQRERRRWIERNL